MNEAPEAQIWSFHPDKEPTKLFTMKPQLDIPDISNDEFALKDFIIATISSFILRASNEGYKVDAIGISTPGNIDRKNHTIMNIARMQYGPHAFSFKPASVGDNAGSDLAPIKIRDECNIQGVLSVDNDVTCMATASHYLDTGNSCDMFVYIYVGAGVNVGILYNGFPLCGSMHPELGHYRARLFHKERSVVLKEDNFCCFGHNHCLESIISKYNLAKHFDLNEESFQKLIDGHKSRRSQHDFVAGCISQLCEIATLTVAPDRIVIGGYVGIELLESIKNDFDDNLSGYSAYKERLSQDYITISSHQPNEIAAFGAAIHGYTETI